jgi:hypothetical protein
MHVLEDGLHGVRPVFGSTNEHSRVHHPIAHLLEVVGVDDAVGLAPDEVDRNALVSRAAARASGDMLVCGRLREGYSGTRGQAGDLRRKRLR